ncbi:MAG: PstS family phosphate ABC transporter substrate-binding protein [Sulfurovaceae bacterium]|nr:PstS family phosphate ABC transporter substrate-binding protein [Sulfurovaceae bacterium]
MRRGLSKIEKTASIVLIMSLLISSKSFAETRLSEGIVKYKPITDNRMVYGSLECKGSTNVGKLLQAWVPEFKKLYPHVKSSFKFTGSGQGITGLMDGTANIGAASRAIKKSEFDAFKSLKGYGPTEVKVSLDALAIYVNRLNKIEEITIEELDAIFSTSRKQGYKQNIDNWKLVNNTNNINKKINIYLFDKNSGTRSYFREKVMLKGDFNFKSIVSDEYTTVSQVVNQVAKDPYGICFGSVGSKNFKVKTLELSKKKQFPSFKPTIKNIVEKRYPLTRYFYLYLDVPAHKPLPKLLYEFCKFALSKNGQKEVLRAGGLPLSPKEIGIELAKIRR